MKQVPTEQAVGHVLCHDITQIIPGVIKDARFRKGHIVTEEDIPVLLSLGKEHLFVWEKAEGMLHENDAALRLAALCKNENMSATEPKEGKIELRAECDGLFEVDVERLLDVNSQDEVIIGTRHGDVAVKAGDKLCATRVIPLVVSEDKLRLAERAAGSEPLLKLTPWKLRTAAVVTTGSEVAKGRIQDAFTPVIIDKLKGFGIEVIWHEIVGDGIEEITQAISKARASGADLMICTGGMSVDPDDLTPGAIKASGADVVCYGAPVLPGAMMLIGYYSDGVPVLGLPGCVMYAKATVFDLLLPRIVAGVRISRRDIARLGHGGLCLGCKECHYPDCSFGKG